MNYMTREGKARFRFIDFSSSAVEYSSASVCAFTRIEHDEMFTDFVVTTTFAVHEGKSTHDSMGLFIYIYFAPPAVDGTTACYQVKPFASMTAYTRADYGKTLFMSAVLIST